MTEQGTAAGGCRYVGRSGATCPEPAQAGRELCFWHDPEADKSGPDIKGRLEGLLREGRSFEGFVLKSADLRDVNLANGDAQWRVNLTDADLSRANLTSAHFFLIDLRGANLMKADLSQANLNRASLGETNLLGAELSTTRLEGVDWGRSCYQEARGHRAERSGDPETAMDHYQEAEEIYRYLTGIAEARGHFGQAGHFYHKGKVMRRMQMRRWSKEWCWSKVVDLLCGYGESPDRLIAFAGLVILGWAVAFYLVGIKGPEGRLGFDPGQGFAANLGAFFNCIYYSVVTFTTLGYGDITPTGMARAFAALEAFIGAFSISLFVVVFVRKMTR